MIDLHTHTNESDGTYTPEELITAAVELRLQALAITDHDTLAGYEKAKPIAEKAGLQLLCGIELSTKTQKPVKKTVHLLGYFVSAPPTSEFMDWLVFMQEARRDRNRRLATKLQSMGLDITLEEVQGLGRSLTGRPHFARLMVQKGYVSSTNEAFQMLSGRVRARLCRSGRAFSGRGHRANQAGGRHQFARPSDPPWQT